MSNPSTKNQWRSLCQQTLGKDPENLAITEANYSSGSKLTFDQFLHLRVVWKYHRTDQLDLSKIVSSKAITVAKNSRVDGIKTDIGLIGRSDPKPLFNHLEEKLFTIVYNFSHLIIHPEETEGARNPPSAATPKVYNLRRRGVVPRGGSPATDENKRATPTAASTPSRNPKTSYEMIVNMSLINLLTCITYTTDTLNNVYWMPDPHPLKLSPGGEDLYRSDVDGILQRGYRKIPYAIVETKPYVRKENQSEVEWQESSQMAAWIFSDRISGLIKGPDSFDRSKERRRFKVSQDRHEVYITIATYSVEYESYISTPKRPGQDQPLSPAEASQAGPSDDVFVDTPTTKTGKQTGFLQTLATIASQKSARKSSERPIRAGFQTPPQQTDLPSPKKQDDGTNVAEAKTKRFGNPLRRGKNAGKGKEPSTHAQATAAQAADRPAPNSSGMGVTQQFGAQKPPPFNLPIHSNPTSGAPSSSVSVPETAPEPSEAFLTMECYGPYCLDNMNQMAELCRTIVALTYDVTEAWPRVALGE